MTPMPHQIVGAQFLADRDFAVLADEPRVGKTGAAIMAADYAFAKSILVITTASGRAVWRRAFPDWSDMSRNVQVLTGKAVLRHDADVVIVGWPSLADAQVRTQLLARCFDVGIADESHWAKNFDAKRTQAAFGTLSRDELLRTYAVLARCRHVWCLTGTPMPNSPFDLYPMLRFGAPERLAARKDRPDVTQVDDFKKRYCKVRPMKIGNGPYARRIEVIVGGQNLDELRDRVKGLMLQRKQTDVGITRPIFEILPLTLPKREFAQAEEAARKIQEAIAAGDTKSLDMHLGPLRRITGALKVPAVAEAVRDEFDGGLDKIVLAYWHREVAEALAAELEKFGVTGIDGSTSAKAREANVAAFAKPTGPRVFLAQIQAAGEAIDLSAAAELLFVEMSFVPKDGMQMAMRITNHNQTRQPRVRVAAVDGSIDEAIQQSLLRKVQTIQEVLK